MAVPLSYEEVRTPEPTEFRLLPPGGILFQHPLTRGKQQNFGIKNRYGFADQVLAYKIRATTAEGYTIPDSVGIVKIGEEKLITVTLNKPQAIQSWNGDKLFVHLLFIPGDAVSEAETSRKPQKALDKLVRNAFDVGAEDKTSKRKKEWKESKIHEEKVTVSFLAQNQPWQMRVLLGACSGF